MLTERVVRDAKPTGRAFTIWDQQIKGLGLQVTQAGNRNYVLRYRDPLGRRRQAILARVTEISLKDVRARAGAELVAIRNGADGPMERRRESKEAPTVADLVDKFFAETVPARLDAGRMSAKTVENYRSQIRRYILPHLGGFQVRRVTRADVEKFSGLVAGGGPQRNRVLQLLSRLFTEAERWEWRPEHSNPVRLVERAVERPRERVLAPSELSALAAALNRLENEYPSQVNAIRVAAMTGLRISEVLGMVWGGVNLELGRAALKTKTGPRVVPLPAAVVSLLTEHHGEPGNDHVFPGSKPGSSVGYKSTRNVFAAAATAAGLDNVRLHDLRRTLATRLAGAGINSYLLRDVLGHKTLSMSNRYVQGAGEALAATVEKGATLMGVE